jgi:hypothetical protein
MALSSTTEMLTLRWRAAQWLLAISEDDATQVNALRGAMRIEGMDHRDILDELALLREQFARRPAIYLRQEIARLWQQLKDRP